MMTPSSDVVLAAAARQEACAHQPSSTNARATSDCRPGTASSSITSRDVDRLSRSQGTASSSAGIRGDRSLRLHSPERGVLGGTPRVRRQMKRSPSYVQKRAEGGLAQSHRLFQHRVEHRRQIAGRGVDHLQHLGGRGLLLQRLALLGQQPRVLHRDHRLGGEVFQQGNLLVGKRAGLPGGRSR